MSEHFEGGPALLEPEAPKKKEVKPEKPIDQKYFDDMIDVAGAALTALEEYETIPDKDKLKEAFYVLEEELVAVADHLKKSPGEDEAYKYYLEIAEKLEIKEDDLKVWIDDERHIRLRKSISHT